MLLVDMTPAEAEPMSADKQYRQSGTQRSEGKDLNGLCRLAVLLQSFTQSLLSDMMYQLFPAHIADALKAGKKVEPESHELVTVFFSDIVGKSP